MIVILTHLEKRRNNRGLAVTRGRREINSQVNVILVLYLGKSIGMPGPLPLVQDFYLFIFYLLSELNRKSAIFI